MQTTTQEIVEREIEIEEVPVNSVWAKVIFPSMLLACLLGMLTIYFYLFG